MANTTYTDWRNKIGYPASGVGDLNDLKMVIAVGNNGKWISYISPGYFYDEDGVEKYQYIAQMTTTATVAAISGTISQSVSFRPAWGPVFVDDTNTNVRYVEHANTYLPGKTATWNQVGSTNVYYTTIPSGQVVTGVRDLTSLTLYSQPTSGDVQDVKSYYYSQSAGRVYVYAKENPPQRFVDIALYQPQLRFREMVVEEGGGVVHTSYPHYRGLVASHGYTSQSIADSDTGVVNHNLGTSIGDWVILDYYIDRSFCLFDHKTIYAYNTQASGATLRVLSESAIPEYPMMAIQTSPASGMAFQFNPMFSDSFRAGFMYHSNTGSSGTPFVVRMATDKQYAIGGWSETIKATATVYDRDGLPIPNTRVTLTHNLPGSGNTVFVLPTQSASTSSSFTTVTDNRGEVHWMVQANTVGVSGLINLVATTINNVSATGSVLNLPVSGALSTGKYTDGFIGLSQSRLKTTKGFSKLYSAPHLLDGIPANLSTGITLKAKGSSTFQFTDTSNAETIALSEAVIRVVNDLSNPFRICGINEEVGVVVANSDTFVAYAQGQSVETTMLEEL